ncbi:Autotransporter beta-domain protein [Pseudobythopirellula maris]|uniref:Autotransporter beta-domain protein n=1 Tax=Pseudobythopirellula maris TaxID=2527991 RepID=A0A5C5ZTI6_9BACT|nr:autotransporter outer membrane beta-barrel domain-containing protein [Pseudobythopirellula maris]TWT90328.1 Autotransporter beta-domain protein [Pseudobythopirellula maris]
MSGKGLSRFSFAAIATGVLFISPAWGQIPGDSLVLEGDFVRTGVSSNGTLGVGGNTSPGFIFDATGAGAFNTSNDYLTPGTPQEGFSVEHDASGVYINNNSGGAAPMGPTSAPMVVPSGTSGFDNSVSWSGAVAGEFTIQHDYGLNNDSKNVQITTTITALSDLDNVRFSRWIDPDSGGTSSINTRGNAVIGFAEEDWVNSESETNGATLGLYSNDDVAHNTAISPGWSTDPDTYTAGSGDTVGDHTIGIGFDIGDLMDGESISFIYFYAVGADANDFVGLGSTYSGRAFTGNQGQIAESLDAYGGAAPAALQTILDTIDPLSDAEVQMALDQYAGAAYGSLPTAGLQHTTFYLSQMSGYLRGRMDPGDPLASSGYAEVSAESAMQLVSYEPSAARGSTGGCCTSHRAWISGYGLGGSAQGDGNADGFSYGLGGTQFAVEESISRNWAAGIWGNMAWGSVDGDTLGERADIENYHFGGHLVGYDGCDYWIALAGAGYDKADIRRNINVGATATARGNMDGWQAISYLERGRSVRHCGWNVQPYAALQYVYLRQNSLVETGAGALNLAIGGVDAHSFRSIMGGRFSTDRHLRNGRRLTPELRAAWIHEFLDTNQVVSNNFAIGGAGAGFAVRGVDLKSDWGLFGCGVSYQANAASRLFAGYDLQVNDVQTLHVGSGGVEFVW